MAYEVLLPKVGLTMEEGVVDEWLVSPGSRVEAGQPLLRMATDKVDVDVEAEASGVFRPAVEVGSSLKPGTRIGWLLDDGEEPPVGDTPESAGGPSPIAASTAADMAIPKTGQPTVSAPYPVAKSIPSGPGRLFASPNARRVAAELNVDLRKVAGTGPGGRIVSEDIDDAWREWARAESSRLEATGSQRMTSPLVRRLARSLRVDLSGVQGSGAGGSLTRADVERAAIESPMTLPNSPLTSGTQRIIPLTGMRGAIARNMTTSLREMAQLTHGYEADVTQLVLLRDQLKTQLGAQGGRIPSVTDFIAKATVLALADHPELNANVQDDGIHVFSSINLGIAVAVPHGLLVPVVRNADLLNLFDLSSEVSRLATSARDGRLMPDDLVGGTFTVTSLGTYGVDFFTPVISPGNVAILGVGRIRDGVRWDSERPIRTDVLTLSLTFDHRAVDGAPAAEFLRRVCDWLARPLALLAE